MNTLIIIFIIEKMSHCRSPETHIYIILYTNLFNVEITHKHIFTHYKKDIETKIKIRRKKKLAKETLLHFPHIL